MLEYISLHLSSCLANVAGHPPMTRPSHYPQVWVIAEVVLMPMREKQVRHDHSVHNVVLIVENATEPMIQTLVRGPAQDTSIQLWKRMVHCFLGKGVFRSNEGFHQPAVGCFGLVLGSLSLFPLLGGDRSSVVVVDTTRSKTTEQKKGDLDRDWLRIWLPKFLGISLQTSRNEGPTNGADS